MTPSATVRTRNGVIRLGTRRSALALAQSGLVAAALREHTGAPVEIVEVSTYGDVSREQLARIGGTGVFVSALRDALLAGDVDVAVHSLKDLPTAAPKELVLAAVPRREDPRDVLVARDGLRLDTLPAGARVGTGAIRRMAAIRGLRSDIELVPIRGNIDTRIAMVRRGDLDAVMLAAAGLNRLGRLGEATQLFDPALVVPAPGQGALAIECRDPEASPDRERAADGELLAALRSLDDLASHVAVRSERALLAELEAGCSAPVGAYAVVVPTAAGEAQAIASSLRLTGVVSAADGTRCLRLSTSGPLDEPEELGRRVATELLGQGAAGLMGECLP